ncbi:MAG: hypothetical protein D6B28_10850 [Gammaproteobacteria bacterium]|nr:MAG: hypothetical protein D6B28_10850 [Gammaproteobacteria bacterium]
MYTYETEIIEFALEGNIPLLSSLREQLKTVSVTGRLNLGSIIRTELKSEQSCSADNGLGVISDLFVEFETLNSPVAPTIEIVNGQLARLVLVSCADEVIPETPKIKRLYYVTYDVSGELIETNQRNMKYAIRQT